ncbi:MAG TPA: ABC transporter permease [Allosphingosinicella sp.]|jgi:putative ABC transport system permease protein|uniref:ABC transporter permease n=1 Tax=Allosphingosinicella sp. TaxID=2823234 RepID=UPI002F2AC0A9
MWRNYVVTGLRALTRNRTYAFINIFGLAIGLAACLLILLYVRYETSYDRWLPDAEHVYQVQSIYTDPETGERSIQQGTHGVITDTLAKDFPQIESIARADGDEVVLLRGGEPTYADMMFTEQNFFDILQLPFLHGDPGTALRNTDSLVLSRSEAVRLLGGVDVVGRTVTGIRRGERYELRVTGVFEDIPRNSHLQLEMVGRITEQQKEECGWGCVNGLVYLKLKPGADAEEINRQLPAWEKRNIPPVDVGGAKVSEGDSFDWNLVNVRDVHLSEAEGEVERPGNDRRTIVTFVVVALLILGIACVNFVNLATARASQRAREVALRKVLGARRKQLVVQFLGESMLLTAIAMLLALAMAELKLPALSAFLNADLTLNYIGKGGVLLPVVGLVLAVGLAGGIYPAFYLSRYQPGAVLRANQSAAEPHGSGRLRSGLVVAQFAVSIGLIICTAIVYAQTEFARTNDPGYRREGLIQVGNLNRAAMIPVTETLLREVEKLDGVKSATASTIFVASGTTMNTNVQVPGRIKPMTIGWYSVHPNFFDTMGIQLLAGRKLSRSFANDNGWTPYEPEEAVEPAQRALAQRGLNVVVNELAAKQMGFPSAAAAIGKQLKVNQFSEDVGLLPITIVGVVQDSRFRSIREPVEPMIFHDRGIYRQLIVRYDSADPEAVRQNIGRVWKRLAAEVPYDGQYADDQLAELYLTEAARAKTFGGFALLAIVIACLGLFGLAAFTAERRTKEIGIRKVFGATVRDIVALLAWQFSKPVVLANLIAWPVAWWVMREWLNQFDARIALTPGPFVFAGLLALVIAIGTIAGHAIKVARTNPIHALRYE